MNQRGKGERGIKENSEKGEGQEIGLDEDKKEVKKERGGEEKEEMRKGIKERTVKNEKEEQGIGLEGRKEGREGMKRSQRRREKNK